MFLQEFFLCLNVVGRTLVYLCQFTAINLSMDNGIPLCLDNGIADAVHYVVSTFLGRFQSLESRPFPLDGVLQAAVYAVQFFFQGMDFIQQITNLNHLTVDFLKQSVKLLHILFQFFFGRIIGNPLTQGGSIGLFHLCCLLGLSFAFHS